MPDVAQTFICVVLSVDQTVFGAGGHHAIGLVGALGDQIVDEGADVAVAAAEDQRFLALNLQRGIDTCHKALYRCFLIAAGAVELTCAVQTADDLGFHGGIQLGGVHTVVFDGISGTGHFRAGQTGNGMHHFDLHLFGQRGGEALDV